jgi:hypothetical protein
MLVAPDPMVAADINSILRAEGAPPWFFSEVPRGGQIETKRRRIPADGREILWTKPPVYAIIGIQ